MAAVKFPCVSCGAEVHYEPGTTVLKCPYCAATNQIPADETGEADGAAAVPAAFEEQDYSAILEQLDGEQEHVEVLESRCKSCNAEVTLDKGVASQNCPFCGSGLIAHNISKRLIKPRGVLPFAIKREVARDRFRAWVSSRWFAPSSLKSLSVIEGDETFKSSSGLCGIYLPYWTYDCKATTPYSGQRGDDYYVTVPRTTMVNGKPRTVMSQERRTRWSPASGTVFNAFDDVLVGGSVSLPVGTLDALGSWDLKNLETYREEYLSGFRAETYTVGLGEGFARAQVLVKPRIEQSVRADIGGDRQMIARMSPAFSSITFKHILLPVWVSAYRYNGKVFRFVVNGRTGEMHGERPYSAWKITFAVLAALIAVLIIAVLAKR
jgi:LSD1 subclass zinc finger protein